MSDLLISPEYLRQQQLLHAAPRGYGGKGDKWAGAVVALAQQYRALDILDYGCGEGTLARALLDLAPQFYMLEYDPAIAGKDAPPAPADLVVCTDVLEHIEPDRLAAVLAHLKTLALSALFVVIATRPASKFLADGRNAHLIVEDAAWWAARLRAAGFQIRDNAPVSPSRKPSREFVAVLQ